MLLLLLPAWLLLLLLVPTLLLLLPNLMSSSAARLKTHHPSPSVEVGVVDDSVSHQVGRGSCAVPGRCGSRGGVDQRSRLGKSTRRLSRHLARCSAIVVVAEVTDVLQVTVCVGVLAAGGRVVGLVGVVVVVFAACGCFVSAAGAANA